MWLFGNKKPKVKATDVTSKNFNEVVLGAEAPVLLDFWASWCGPCKVMTPIVDELAREMENEAITLCKINTEEELQLPQHFKIKSVPTIIVMYRKQVIFRHSGMIPKPNLKDMLEDLVAKHNEDTLQKTIVAGVKEAQRQARIDKQNNI